MKNQFEQHMNAVALDEMGVKVLKKLNEKSIIKIRKWRIIFLNKRLN